MTQVAKGVATEKNAATGTLIAVVGPSGVGKDSLMDIARHHFAGRDDLRFVRRVITRAEDAVGEDHHAVTSEAFEELSKSGAFAVSWQAHGLGYGIPSDVYDDLAAGHVVIANGSRSALDAFHAAFPHLVVVNVTARPEILAKRLAARGRETAADIEARLTRSSQPLPPDLHVVTIDNSGELDLAGEELVNLIQGLFSKG
ncbi:phosphonate metabolism protein/1,5-bisphosphokinase (PRPP-forming) PhnN [Rhizobium sp. WL3]|uniref:phosphonate metabolism protein/1,5-bisphosphokinase (PRPP-forming) PhnN n=1 Tax=Rhizobium sp. WL3 TaxID=2603277 RepID=UPI0011C1E985|nr:phosphonate metabolism protein/1,5-bisphosphokinase (PRPP-forming) PhnN [Rhizobium sp. WL3]QEE45686.1 phosphonate metabolism protein/1,5-bisphosphokinase (PRPP-forming) PhnN [Rhizobium sp. WL3]